MICDFRFAICDCQEGRSKIQNLKSQVSKVGPPASVAFAIRDVSRQNITGRHGNFLNALFFWSMISTTESEAFLVIKSVGKIRTKTLVFSVLALALMSACRGNSANFANTNSTPSNTVPMRVVTDDLGRRVIVPVKITRAVSTAPSVTENIFAVGAGDRLVGVTTFCNYPEEAKSIAKIGDTMTPNIETIIALKPDIVFVSTASQIEAFMKTVEANGIAVYITNPASLDDVLKNLSQLGIIFDTGTKTNDLISNLYTRVSAVQNACNTIHEDDEEDEWYDKKVGIVHVFVQISREPLFTVGKTAFLNDLLEIAGARSVTANVESAYPKLSKETASAVNPQALILSQSDDNNEPNDVFKNSPAVKNGRVYKINADILSRPGPRLVDALEQIARDLHPEKFK